MNEPEVFVLAEQALVRVVDHIDESQWDMTMPENFTTHANPHAPTLREVINNHAYDDTWVPDMLAGRTMDEVGAQRFDGDLLGDDPKSSFRRIVDTACAAAGSGVDLDSVAHLSFGDYPVREYFWQINMFRALRAYDIARALGVEANVPAALVQGVWDEVSPHAEEWRTIGVFPAEVPVLATAPLLDRLLGLTGRDPAA